MSHRWNCPDRWTAEREGREDADRQWWAREPEREKYGCEEADRHYRDAFEERREEERRAEDRRREEREEEERYERRAAERRQEERDEERDRLYAEEQEYLSHQAAVLDSSNQEGPF